MTCRRSARAGNSRSATCWPRTKAPLRQRLRRSDRSPGGADSGDCGWLPHTGRARRCCRSSSNPSITARCRHRFPGSTSLSGFPTPANRRRCASYSLSGDPGAGHYRISVKREDHGVVSRWLHTHIRAGSVVEAAAPRGEFCLAEDSSPVVLLSAGIGATPVLAMAHALAAAQSRRQIWWLHTTRDAESHAFAAEVTTLIKSLPDAQQHVFYTRGDGADSFIVRGRLNRGSIAALDLPADATVYLCGPSAFMDTMREALTATGINPTHTSTPKCSAPCPRSTPASSLSRNLCGHTSAMEHRAPGHESRLHAADLASTGHPNTAASSNSPRACDVPTRYSCRSGVCHTCATPVIEGATTYSQRPLEEPSAGAVLICVATPRSDLVLDL